MPQRRFEHSNNPEIPVCEGAILVPFGRESYVAAAVERFDGKPMVLNETTDRMLYTLEAGGDEITLVYSGMGGPAAANALEMLAANGTRRVVVVGACGGVGPSLRVGDLVAVTGAVRGEGASRYYAPVGFPAAFDTSLTRRLETTAREHAEGKVHCGVVYTTDASYRQGPEVYESFGELLLGVECECATVAVVAARLALEAGGLLFCTDNVTLPSDADRRYRGLAAEPVRAGFEAALDSAVDVLSASSTA